jgi:hypothetical protein
MHEYQIRVLSSGHPIAVIEATHLSDHAAMRSARDLAGNRPFEVWRGLDCIYAPPRTRLAPATASLLATAGAWMKRVL